jgi:DNA-binding CsgD family transcriptional regulator/GAF domain-containing protein
MPTRSTDLLDPTRILFDLQQGHEIAQSFSGCLEPESIAHRMTEGLVERFHCAFARIWLLETDPAMLRLVASAGMYTRIDGFFGRVPMGAYKVGKIAQNRVSFLSNNLASESWVGNREWAVANNIRGFAGYPLMIQSRVIGVLATFSHHSLEPEFLEVLQTLCTIATIALDTAIQYQREKQTWHSSHLRSRSSVALSDQLSEIFTATRLTLVGTEQPLSVPIVYVFLKTAERLNRLHCAYCRLVYGETTVALTAIVPSPNGHPTDWNGWDGRMLEEISFAITGLGGHLLTQHTSDQRAIQIRLDVPYEMDQSGLRLRIQCRLPLLQLAFTHLARAAGLTLCLEGSDLPLLTDDENQIGLAKQILWVQHGPRSRPNGIQAKLDLSIQPEQLRQALEAVLHGESWGMDIADQPQPVLSDRELEILSLLAQGLRDRNIADRLVISESTVKFHMNNVLSKLKVRTRYQAIYQAVNESWI